MVAYIAIAIIAYAIGSINFSVIFSRKFAGFDVIEKGSGNAGTTNMLRSVGKKAAAVTLICDILKGIVSILIALAIGYFVKDVDKSILVQIAGFFAVLGHTFPIFFEFRGGKGVATALGVILLVDWQIGLICLAFGLVLIILTRMVSLGSIMTAVLFPILTIFIHNNYLAEGNYIVFGILFGVLVVFNHRANLKRIMEGTENRISFKKQS